VTRPRVLLAKPGLDGHDRGIKVIAMALRDAGAEVVYLGLRRSIPEIADAAVEEDVDVIGISVLSGAHLPLATELLEALRSRDVAVPVVVGGTIPAGDVAVLRDRGVAAVFPVGTSMPQVVDAVLTIASRERVGR
jgi:methylmalonyl-CoA mutase C-terminal domain/subunit